MGMGNCDKCWDTPCLCGHQYEHLKFEDLNALTHILLRLCFKKEKEIQAACNHEDLSPMRDNFPCPEIVGYFCPNCRKKLSLEEAEKCHNSNNTLNKED